MTPNVSSTSIVNPIPLFTVVLADNTPLLQKNGMISVIPFNPDIVYLESNSHAQLRAAKWKKMCVFALCALSEAAFGAGLGTALAPSGYRIPLLVAGCVGGYVAGSCSFKIGQCVARKMGLIQT